ncbi:MAG: hypothetical protein ABI073_09640 [Luteolibacter sp.]
MLFEESNKGDRFNVALGWAKSRMRPYINTSEKDSFDLNIGAFQKIEHCLSVKWMSGGPGADWSIRPLAKTIEEIVKELEPITDEEALVIVSPVFQESIKAIHAHAIPFLERMNVDISWATHVVK